MGSGSGTGASARAATTLTTSRRTRFPGRRPPFSRLRSRHIGQATYCNHPHSFHLPRSFGTNLEAEAARLRTLAQAAGADPADAVPAHQRLTIPLPALEERKRGGGGTAGFLEKTW